MVQPGDYLAAAQAGANVGLNIAKMRQASDFQNAENDQKREERMSAAAKLAAQLANARDLKVMDIAQRQNEATMDLDMSKAALDFRKSGLDFDKAKENFDQEQARLKMRSDADVALQTGNLLKEASEAKTPEERAKIAARYSRSPVADNVMLKSLSEMDAENSQKAKDKRAEEIAAAKLSIQQVFDAAGGGKAGYEAVIKHPDWTKIPTSDQAQWRLSQPKSSGMAALLEAMGGNPAAGAAPGAEVMRKTSDGRTAIFDATTKKFLRYAN
jgi:hypothetical protein